MTSHSLTSLTLFFCVICINVYGIDYTLPATYNVFFQNSHRTPRLFDSDISDYYSHGNDNYEGFGDEDYNFGPTTFGPGISQFQTSTFPARPGFPGTQRPNPLDPSGLGCGTPPVSCPKTPYRSYDGSCNNLRRPILGTPNTPYTRLIGPNYGDNISTPPVSKASGRPLPSARLVSLAIYPDVPVQDPIWTLAAMQYGQIITHDMSMIAGSTQTKPHNTQCCSNDGQLLENANIPEHCFPIIIPRGDPLLSKFNINCMNFVRTITDRDRNCVGGNQPAEQLTAVNHFMDLSLVYGNNQNVVNQVRSFRGGRLRTEVRYGKEWPPASNNKTGDCAPQAFEEPCYLAGDLRVNQNPQLTILQIILLREHNRIADELSKINPHWDDETLFQESRRINIAEHEYISYYEWLPIFIGLRNSIQNKIIYNTKSYIDDYDESVNPTVLNEHATAAFRFFHSLIQGNLNLIEEHRHAYGNIRMSDWFNRPLVLEQNNNFDDLTRGMSTQPQSASDEYHTSEVTQFMFRNNMPFGQDLKALDIQRNRDHGLASYNDYRVYCGLPKARTFHDFLDTINHQNVEKLQSLYESPDDVDLTVGGSLEQLVPGTLSGPTFLCILTEQFYRTRVGDRFWFEHGAEGNPFTIEQLNSIRKTSISRLFCDNAHHIQSMQPRGFERVSEHNQVVPCEALPSVDLSLWRDIKVGYDHSHLYYKK